MTATGGSLRGSGARTGPLPSGPLLEGEWGRAGALLSLVQLGWFIRLRWGLVGGALAVLAVERFVTPEAVRPGALVVPILALAVLNLVWMGVQDVLLSRLRRGAADEEGLIRRAGLFANGQVGLDLLLLTVILRYTGGVENPMALFYLFHIGIGALLLRPWQAILQGVWAMALYGGLAAGEYSGVLPHRWEFLPQFACPGMYARGEYVLAALAAMACGVFGTLYFTLHVTGRLAQRQRQLREAYDALRRSEAAIFDLQQRRSRFLQTAAHQLKGPLASIETLIGLLTDRVVPPAAVTSTYEKIRQRCREGVQQVGELLTLARVQRGDPRRHRRSVADVRAVAADVCARFAAQAESRKITLELRAPEAGPLSALIDPADLADCISNLVDNAIKFTMGPGSVTVELAAGDAPAAHPRDGASDNRAGARGDGAEAGAASWVRISVSDTGIGIDADTLTEARDPAARGSIFDAFRRGNNALAAGIPGTGLGLAIVREVVEQAGGRILLHSRRGEGSTFTVVLPTPEAPGPELTIRETRESVVVLEPLESQAAELSAEACNT